MQQFADRINQCHVLHYFTDKYVDIILLFISTNRNNAA